MHHTTEEFLAALPGDAETPPPCAPSAASAMATAPSCADGVGARAPLLTALFASTALAACGGGGSDGPAPLPGVPPLDTGPTPNLPDRKSVV